MSDTRWRIREGVTAYGLLILISGIASVVVFLALDHTPESFNPEDPATLVGMIVSAIVGMLGALTYAYYVAGRAIFEWGEVGVKWGVFSVVLVMPILAFGYGWTVFMEAMGQEALPQTVVQGMLETPSMPALLLALVYGIVGAAVFEECLFRGFIQPAFVGQMGVVKGIALTSGLFGVIHAADPWAILPTAIIGATAGFLRHKSGGVFAPMVFHGANNFAAIILTVAAI